MFMPIGRPTKPLNVTSEENGKLAMQVRRLELPEAIVMRAPMCCCVPRD